MRIVETCNSEVPSLLLSMIFFDKKAVKIFFVPGDLINLSLNQCPKQVL